MQNQAISQNGDQLTAYRSVFVAYILGALRESLARVRAAENLVPDAQRVQAWHVLSYALRVDDAWPDACELMLALAPKMEQAGFRGEWIAYLERGVARSHALGDRRGEAELSLHVGHLHRLVSAFPQAEAWLARSLRHFEHNCDDRGMARALNQLAYVAYLQHHYADAAAQVKRAMALLPPDDAERAMSCFVLGMVAIDHKRWQEAEKHHRRSLYYREKSGELRGIAWSLQNLGYALTGQNRYIEAIDYYTRAIHVLDRIQDMGNKATVQMNIGIAHSLLGEHTAALQMYKAAIPVFRTSHDRLKLAKAYTNAGIDYLALQEWECAEESFSNSIAAFKTLGDISAYFNALDGLGTTYLKQQKVQQAIEIFEDALNELSQYPELFNYAYMWQKLSEHRDEAVEIEGSIQR